MRILGNQNHIVAVVAVASTVLPRVDFHVNQRVAAGSMPMAMMPPLRTFENSLSDVFFTVPCRVAKNSSPD